MRLMKELKVANILMKIDLEEKNYKHLFSFRKKLIRFHCLKNPAFSQYLNQSTFLIVINLNKRYNEYYGKV